MAAGIAPLDIERKISWTKAAVSYYDEERTREKTEEGYPCLRKF
jgi:hypothetical protein